MAEGEGGFSCLSISELISILRTSFRASVFDKVEKVLVARERNLKEELDRREKECAFLQKKKRPSCLGEKNAKRFESEHAERGVEDENWKGREAWATLLEKYYPNTGAGYSSVSKKFQASSVQLGVGIGGVIGEGEAPERCENRNESSDRNEKIAPAGGTDHVITLQKKPGAKRKRSSFADSLDEIVNIDDDDDDDEITESSKPSKKPQESKTEASPGRLNEDKTKNTWTKHGTTGWKVCEEHSLLKPIPEEIFFVDSDSESDDDSLDDDSRSSDSVC